ncbi:MULTISPECIES: hypothetical protein [Streptacidiphilus]|uniref:Uncharacterized protein n=1 Tax=Streptacidiphilus cavernicola TaxID=3342716 RepID=A0ABV6V077_9ACTN|nr:hypothetical protein [Streptacidiphilus jeojiense]
MSAELSDSMLWHNYWLGMVGPRQREQRRGEHRADIVTVTGCVVEVQHASMSPTQIDGREREHGHMMWIWDGREFYQSGRLQLASFNGGVVQFHWRNPRRTMRACRRTVLLDLWQVGETGERMVLQVDALGEDGRGEGRLITHRALRLWMVSGIEYRSLTELPGRESAA